MTRRLIQADGLDSKSAAELVASIGSPPASTTPGVGVGPNRRRIVRLLGYLAITGLVGVDSLSMVSAWQDWSGSQKHIESCPVSSESWG
jgi:hypothetical protein